MKIAISMRRVININFEKIKSLLVTPIYYLNAKILHENENILKNIRNINIVSGFIHLLKIYLKI